jgi:phosphopantothenate synthetase
MSDDEVDWEWICNIIVESQNKINKKQTEQDEKINVLYENQKSIIERLEHIEDFLDKVFSEDEDEDRIIN